MLTQLAPQTRHMVLLENVMTFPTIDGGKALAAVFPYPNPIFHFVLHSHIPFRIPFHIPYYKFPVSWTAPSHLPCPFHEPPHMYYVRSTVGRSSRVPLLRLLVLCPAPFPLLPLPTGRPLRNVPRPARAPSTRHGH